jgi:nitrogen fixation protein NifB
MSEQHPCFDPNHAQTARRVHLPVAGSCNIQCKFCNRLYDCVNEQRPGVTSAVLTPMQAVAYLEAMMERMGSIEVVGIAGPGDSFAEPELTLETLDLVHNRFPGIALCISSNGLMVARYAGALAKCGVTHASITINGVDPAIVEKLVPWIRFEKKISRGADAGRILIERQLAAVEALHKAGITVKVNTLVIPGVNQPHIAEIARLAAAAGADVHNCMPFIPVAGSEMERFTAPDHDIMQKARWTASAHLPQVRHCNRCRADAAGLLGNDDPGAFDLLRHFASLPRDPSQIRPYIAVASREGALVNEHLGHARHFYLFRRAENGAAEIVETRQAPPPGGLLSRWRDLARILRDCRTVIVQQCGEPPKAVLEDEGISVVVTEGLASEAVEKVFEGKAVRPPVEIQPCCGSKNGGGCG